MKTIIVHTDDLGSAFDIKEEFAKKRNVIGEPEICFKRGYKVRGKHGVKKAMPDFMVAINYAK